MGTSKFRGLIREHVGDGSLAAREGAEKATREKSLALVTSPGSGVFFLENPSFDGRR